MSCPCHEKRRILERGRSKCPGAAGKLQLLLTTSPPAHLLKNAGSSRGVARNALREIQDPRAPLHSSSPSPLQHHGILQRGPSKRAPRESPGTSSRQEHLILSKSRKATSSRGVAPQRQCREEAAVVSIDGLTSCFAQPKSRFRHRVPAQCAACHPKNRDVVVTRLDDLF